MTRPGPLTGGAPDWLIWAGTRLFVLGIVAGIIPWAEQVNDLTIYSRWVRNDLSHWRFPVDDQMWQYPPLAGPVFMLGELAPGGRIGYSLVFLAFDAAVMAMVSRRAATTGAGSGRMLWALAPLIVGPLLLARFDVVPTAAVVAAVILSARPLASGAMAAVGAWLKLWPALAILGLPRRALPRGVLGAALTSASIAAVMLLTTSNPLSFLREQGARGLQIEAVAAWPYHVMRVLGVRPQGEPITIAYQYGAHEFVAPGLGVAAAAATLVTIALLATVVAARLNGRLEHLAPADVVLAAVLFSIVGSRVFSGQYFIWLLGLSAIALCEPHTRMRPAIALIVVSGLATHLIYPWLYSALLAGQPLAVAVQTVRVLAIVAATAAALWRLLEGPQPPGPGLTQPIR